MVFSIKQSAREVLRGNWIKVVSLIFICYFIGILAGTNITTINFKSDGISISLLTFSTSDSILGILLAAFIGSIGFFAVVDLIHNIKYQDGRKFLSAFTYSFKNKSLLLKGFVVNSLIRLLQFFAVIIFVFAILQSLWIIGDQNLDMTKITIGIVLALLPLLLVWLFLGLSQAMYILYDKPKIKLTKSIYLSFKLMKGNKWSLIGLYISFIGWFFLGLLALIIGVFWSFTYFEAARFEFYQMLKSNDGEVNELIS
ncbi:DUF975 family protein [Evansella halocellulosilytica]|uniref:DUF975 family protein n=1 Tax=Evansella halocellulosilytica TaxID=2011013 RepID=UPI000BB917FD|nr:DUF975 family protein [Evansella halocellulosilytica]